MTARLPLRFAFVALGLVGGRANKLPSAHAPIADGGTTVVPCATWPMPNSTPGLPHPQSFDLSRDEVVADRITGLMWQRNIAGNPDGLMGGSGPTWAGRHGTRPNAPGTAVRATSSSS